MGYTMSKSSQILGHYWEAMSNPGRRICLEFPAQKKMNTSSWAAKAKILVG